jgi:hypothetical protein
VSLQQTSLAVTVPTTHNKGDIRDACSRERGVFGVVMYEIALNPASEGLPLSLAAAAGPRISVRLPYPSLCNEGSSFDLKPEYSAKMSLIYRLASRNCAYVWRYPQTRFWRWTQFTMSARKNRSLRRKPGYRGTPLRRSPSHCEAPWMARQGTTCVIAPASGMRLAPFHPRG